MKVNQDSTIRGPESATTPKEITKPAGKVNLLQGQATTNLADPITVGRQRAAIETKGFSDLTASLLQRSLASRLPSRSELINTAATNLVPKLPQLLVQSGKDPDKFMSAVRDQVESSRFNPLGNINNQDIAAIAFIVLKNSAKSAQEDLRDIMDKVKNINESKAQMRELLQQAQRKSASQKDDDD